MTTVKLKIIATAAFVVGFTTISVSGSAQAKKLPDGSIIYEDGTRKLPNGTVIYKDGSNEKNGAKRLPDGTVVVPGDRRYPETGRRDNGRYGKDLPPGQAKKKYGGRAKDYAPGQQKKWKKNKDWKGHYHGKKKYKAKNIKGKKHDH